MKYLKSESFLAELKSLDCSELSEMIGEGNYINVRYAHASGYVKKGSFIICRYKGRFGEGFTVRAHMSDRKRCCKFTFILTDTGKEIFDIWAKSYCG